MTIMYILLLKHAFILLKIDQCALIFLLVHLLQRLIEKEVSFHLLVPMPIRQKQEWWGHVESGSQEPLPGPSTWDIFHYIPRHINRKIGLKMNSNCHLNTQCQWHSWWLHSSVPRCQPLNSLINFIALMNNTACELVCMFL